MQQYLSALQKKIKNSQFDAILISSVANIVYLTNFSGFSNIEREAFLLVSAHNAYLFTDSRYKEAVRVAIPKISVKEITITTPFRVLLETVIKEQKLTTLGFEATSLTVQEYTTYIKYLKSHNKKIVFKPLQDFLSQQREIKDTQEIKKIASACAIGDKTLDYILTQIKPSKTEKELALAIEFFIKQHDATTAFRPIVAFGKNAALPHHVSSGQRLKARDCILLDFGVKKNNYCSDMTRTVFLGKPTVEQKKIYQTVYEAQTKAIEYLNNETASNAAAQSNNGIKASAVDTIARKHILDQGYPTIPHSLGHGIGIEVHEQPRLSPNAKDTLIEGMVFSIEPGIYIPGFMGVRIEDLVVIKNNKLTQLTKANKSLIEL